MEPLTHAQKELYDWLVEYIRQHQYSPSIRQMMQAMNLRSPAPVQSRLEHLRKKGYINWTEGRARTIRIIHPANLGVPILGAIATDGSVETFTEAVVPLDLTSLFRQPDYFALKVTEASLGALLIAVGDILILQPVADLKTLADGTMVVAKVEEQRTMLKFFYRKSSRILLKSVNGIDAALELPVSQVQVQGALVGVWRGYGREG
ncbi:LexA family transcriptional repressor [Neosynechococcus sphagnicola sy1]|uniref:LexA family transcriptional repressor n=1 Tax=Neosynechococcus sphagnicola sy1 TaxID=1497020 RepID=A0A098TLY4_9CYAN|nr:transcriptional repressor LexA [Neosynechococcus sphagnicola]KGF73319.1 LexA family transcriptional repressor [Neosynechococcus sphagnicola sy1]